MADQFPASTKMVLSPAAQAVLDAVCDNTEPNCDTQHIIAAALRAAADQVVPTTIDPRLSTVRSDLMRIARELDNNATH
jgi:hypothetical protein